MSDPRPMSMVRFSAEYLPKEYRDAYPMDPEHMYIYLGEIVNMLGHCVVMDHSNGEMFSGYHIGLFTEISEDE